MARRLLITKLYLALIITGGVGASVYPLLHWHCQQPARTVCYLALAMVAAGLKVSIPAVTGTLSVGFLFPLVGIVELGLPEALLLGGLTILLQCFWHARVRASATQLAFNLASISLTITLAYYTYHVAFWNHQGVPEPFVLLAAASVYFLSNTSMVSIVIGLTDAQDPRKVWRDGYSWSFTYYLVGAALTGLLHAANRYFDWPTALLLGPVVFAIHYAYQAHRDRIEGQRQHVADIAALQLRTVETLALAVEAKDPTTHAHLHRVQCYALAVGRELGLSGTELEALQAAALLHDVGKIAVPEAIISKPGKLTPEEFDKMKIHPVVGAEIVERMKFPYAVAPMVRGHHERWNGSGYPDGLKEDQIPLGARILAAVDCLDALASDRQYRRALPLDKAMEVVVREAGTSFDPAVVEVLQRRYVELEATARAHLAELTGLDTEIVVSRGLAPATGFEQAEGSGGEQGAATGDIIALLAAVRQDVQSVFDMADSGRQSLTLAETLAILAMRLRPFVAFDTLAIYVRQGELLHPAYVTGEHAKLLEGGTLPVGSGLSGWVAEHRRPIVNGNPGVESSVLAESGQLAAALAVPLEGSCGIVGVLTFYRTTANSFLYTQQRLIESVSTKIALAIEGAQQPGVPFTSTGLDQVTGLPNEGALFENLNERLLRSNLDHDPSVGLLVCSVGGLGRISHQYGEQAAAQAMYAIAQCLRRNTRATDHLARMGQDRIVLTLANIDAERLRALCSAIGLLVAAVGRELCGGDLLSLRIAEAQYPSDGIDAEQLLSSAERRLFRAKPLLVNDWLGNEDPAHASPAHLKLIS